MNVKACYFIGHSAKTTSQLLVRCDIVQLKTLACLQMEIVHNECIKFSIDVLGGALTSLKYFLIFTFPGSLRVLKCSIR